VDESKDAQVLFTSAAYDILLVLIETHCGISSIMLTLWASLEVEKALLEVKQERVRTEWEIDEATACMEPVKSQDYAV